MPTVWRIVPEHRAANAFDGEGARLFGGRWNSPGTRMVYTSDSRALAALEILIHLTPPTMTHPLHLIGVEIEPDWIETIPNRKLPRQWTSAIISPATKQLGDEWIRSARSPVLRIPSVIIPQEDNFLLNPSHPALAHLHLVRGTIFSPDPRLLPS
jgi:RES domain-containing protein